MGYTKGFQKKFLLILSGVLLFLFLIAYFFYALQPVAAGGEVTHKDVIMFRIAKGEGLREVGARLSNASLIKSISVFKFYTLLSGSAQKLQPGVYELSGAMSVPAIVSRITVTGNNEIAVTLPEGSSLRDIDYLLSRFGVIEEGELVV